MIISLFYVTMFVLLNAKLCSIYALILEVFGGLNLVSLSVFGFFWLKKSGLIFKSTVAATLQPTGSLRHVLSTHSMQCQYLSVLIHDHIMHPNTSVNSVNEHY